MSIVAVMASTVTLRNNFFRGKNENHCVNPSDDIAPVRHGQWIIGNGLQAGYKECSRCGEIVKYGYSLYGVHNFCNYCGAKMDGEVQ